MNQSLDAFASSYLMIILSELGDKTFFIASLLAMHNPNNLLQVFLGATFALICMTILSSTIGIIIFYILSPRLTLLVSSLSFVYFAITLFLAFYHDISDKAAQPQTVHRNNGNNNDNNIENHHDHLESSDDELQEVEKELEMIKIAIESYNNKTSNCQQDESTIKEQNQLNAIDLKTSNSNNLSNEEHGINQLQSTRKNKQSTLISQNQTNSPLQHHNNTKLDFYLMYTNFTLFKTLFISKLASSDNIILQFVSPLFIQCFVLTFVAEWADRSMVSTILLSSSKNSFIVIVSCVLGHMCCTTIAILCGKFLATQLSEKHMNLISSILFTIFSLIGFYEFIYYDPSDFNVILPK